MSPVC